MTKCSKYDDLYFIKRLSVNIPGDVLLRIYKSFDRPSTAWKVSKYEIFSGPYFPAFGLSTEIYGVFSPNAGKYGPEKTTHLDTFHAVLFGLRRYYLWQN